jgi:AcrB/AcrD/AcrF family
MALALDEGGEIQAPMGRAIIGGVITSTLLTLIVVPVLYSYLDQMAAWAKRRFGATTHAAAAGGAMPDHMPASKE